jgi:predicted amidohydrolase YtcJ
MANNSSLKKNGRFLLLVALFLISASQCWAQQYADIILYGGNILTANRPKPADSSVAEAVAVRGDRIVAVGTNQEILQMAGPQTLKIDLEYKTVIPGRIDTQVPLADLKSLAEDIRNQAEAFLAQGVTTVSTHLDKVPLASIQKLDTSRDLPLRVAYAAEVSARDQDAEALLQNHEAVPGSGMLWNIGFYLASTDGPENSAAACMSKTYPREAKDFPMWKTQTYGTNGNCLPNGKWRSTLDAILKSGSRATFDIHGDKGLDDFLEALESFSGQFDIKQKRFGVEHCAAIRKDQIARAQKFDIAFSCDPPLGVHLEDGTKSTATEILFGRQEGGDMRAPFRSMIDAGLRPSLQTDSLNYYSFLATQQLIVRAFPNTRIPGPQQRISRQEALHMSTRWAAEYVGKEKELGSIEVGKSADMAILDRNYVQVRQDGLNEINVLVTVLGGKIVYTEPDYAQRKGLPQVGYRGNLGSVLIRGRLTDKLPYQ